MYVASAIPYTLSTLVKDAHPVPPQPFTPRSSPPGIACAIPGGLPPLRCGDNPAAFAVIASVGVGVGGAGFGRPDGSPPSACGAVGSPIRCAHACASGLGSVA